MRILVITNLYPRPGHSTIATYNREQFRALAQEHEVRIVAPVPWTERVRDLLARTSGPKSCTQDQIPVRYPTYYFSPKVGEQFWGHSFLWSVRKEVRKAAAEFGPDVILASWAHPDGWAATRLGRELGLPVVVKVHGSDILLATRSERRRKCIAEALCQANAVIAVSRDLANHVIELGVDPANVEVIQHGVDPAIFCPGDQTAARGRLGIPLEGRNLLFVGNMLLQKGVGVLLEACAKLAQRKCPVNCYIVGMGSDERELRALCRNLRLEKTVHFMGARPQDQLPDWYRSADLVVLPSFSEGIPNVLREAMMCGRRFVATNVGGISEITNPEVGTLVKPGNPDELCKAIATSLAGETQVDRAAAAKLCLDWEAANDLLVRRLSFECERFRGRARRNLSIPSEQSDAGVVRV
jgi:teichuronic acid biosynthesis glycosyltransferase TuaC